MRYEYSVLINIRHWRTQFVEDFKQLFTGIENVASEALCAKVDHMVFKGDLDTVLRMLYRMVNKGVKNLPTSQKDYYHRKLYKWVDRQGNEKFSHGKNQPKAHFRWNYGERHTLTYDCLQAIKQFIGNYKPVSPQ